MPGPHPKKCHHVQVHMMNVRRLQSTSSLEMPGPHPKKCHHVQVHMMNVRRLQSTSSLEMPGPHPKKCHHVQVHMMNVRRDAGDQGRCITMYGEVRFDGEPTAKQSDCNKIVTTQRVKTIFHTSHMAIVGSSCLCPAV